MGKPETNVGDLCQELGVTRSTLYRHVSPRGEGSWRWNAAPQEWLSKDRSSLGRVLINPACHPKALRCPISGATQT